MKTNGIDLTGMVFGYWTVIKLTDIRKNSSLGWLCHCVCGVERVVSGIGLRQGKSKSCGCKAKNHFISELGNTYGRLTVLVQAGHKYGNPLWLCRCECGKEIVARGVSLRFGKIKSCGCSRLGKPQKRGPDSPHWGGGRKLRADGYISIYKPGHPHSDTNGFVLEHKFVMSEIIGRPLTKKETVHHINGVKIDNRPENLELWASTHHKGQRVSDLVTWAKELLVKYEPTALKV